MSSPQVRAALAHQGGGGGARGQAELQDSPLPTAAHAGGPSLSSSSAAKSRSAYSPVPSPLPQQSRPGARELKKRRAPGRSWAKATSAERPRGPPRPSAGEPRSEHQHSLHIVSRLHCQSLGPVGPRVTQASETPGLTAVTQSKARPCQACHPGPGLSRSRVLLQPLDSALPRPLQGGRLSVPLRDLSFWEQD